MPPLSKKVYLPGASGRLVLAEAELIVAKQLLFVTALLQGYEHTLQILVALPQLHSGRIWGPSYCDGNQDAFHRTNLQTEPLHDEDHYIETGMVAHSRALETPDELQQLVHWYLVLENLISIMKTKTDVMRSQM